MEVTKYILKQWDLPIFRKKLLKICNYFSRRSKSRSPIQVLTEPCYLTSEITFHVLYHYTMWTSHILLGILNDLKFNGFSAVFFNFSNFKKNSKYFLFLINLWKVSKIKELFFGIWEDNLIMKKWKSHLKFITFSKKYNLFTKFQKHFVPHFRNYTLRFQNSSGIAANFRNILKNFRFTWVSKF